MDGGHSGVYAQLKDTDGRFQGVEAYWFRPQPRCGITEPFW